MRYRARMKLSHMLVVLVALAGCEKKTDYEEVIAPYRAPVEGTLKVAELAKKTIVKSEEKVLIADDGKVAVNIDQATLDQLKAAFGR